MTRFAALSRTTATGVRCRIVSSRISFSCRPRRSLRTASAMSLYSDLSSATSQSPWAVRRRPKSPSRKACKALPRTACRSLMRETITCAHQSTATMVMSAPPAYAAHGCIVPRATMVIAMNADASAMAAANPMARWIRVASLSLFRSPLEHDTELLHAAIERLPAQPERLGGARDAAVRVQQRRLDLHALERDFLGARFACCSEAEVRGSDRVAGRERRRAVHAVLQLAHVAGPVVRQQRGLCGVVERVAGEERFGERQHVFAAFAQRRDGDLDDGDAEVEILPEGAARDC